MIGQQY